ncbi:MAG: SMI1/KNR4 family protein [Bacteroidota bacterium]
MYFESILEILRKEDVKGISPEQIEHLQNRLGVSFPASILEALSLIGYKAFDLNGMNSLMHAHAGSLDTVKFEEQQLVFKQSFLEKRAEAPPPKHLLIDIWDLHYYYAFVLVDDLKPDPPVYLYDPSDGNYKEYAPSYSHYMLNSSLINFYYEESLYDD